MLDDETVEAQLQEVHPRPAPGFVDRLERQLFPQPEARRSSRRRPLLVGAAAAAGLASIALAAGLAGGGPLGGDDGPHASEDCRYVTVKKPGRIPRLSFDEQGRPRLYSRRAVVKRTLKRCR